MVFIRSKRINGKTYYYIVESYWKNGEPHQRVLLYLGTADALLRRLKRGEWYVPVRKKSNYE